MTTDLVEELALHAAEMKPLGLQLEAYLELPVRVIEISASDFDPHSPHDDHVEIVALCESCGRPIACMGKVENGCIVADGDFDHAPPLTDECGSQPLRKMSAFRKLVFTVVDTVRH